MKPLSSWTDELEWQMRTFVDLIDEGNYDEALNKVLPKVMALGATITEMRK